MLKGAYKSYKDLHIYTINKNNIRIDDDDLIGIWNEENSSLIFFHKNKDELMRSLSEKENFIILNYTVIPYADWESGEYVKKFKIGKWEIVPEWEIEEQIKENQIVIDPSVAFGSGFHSTTRMILESFNKFVSKHREISSCIDLGCGTGILSIFAGKCGINKVLAVDNNNLAYEVCKKNVRINKLENRITILFEDIFKIIPFDYEVVFANLYYNLLEKLFRINDFWSSKFYFFSGFIKKMKERIIRNFPDIIEILEISYKEDWCMIFAKRKV